MMKKMSVLLLIALLLIPACAAAYTNPKTGRQVYYTEPVYASLNQEMMTRTGPGTQYSSPGTFLRKGDRAKLISVYYDHNSVGWVQAEFSINGRPVRLYTGLKRFDGMRNHNLYYDDVRCEGSFLRSSCTPLLGPGYEYLSLNMTLRSGSEVYIVGCEGNFYQCDFYGPDGNLHRGWFPGSEVM